MRPYDSPNGTVWQYKDVLPTWPQDDVYIVLDRPYRGLRPYLNLMTGEIGNMSKHSRWNSESTLLAEAT